ncbi:MAG: short-chain fatty acid transporter [Ottowia sp.]|nr:short-chain fatty acid transporter [Ottowia sp.]
MKAFTQACVRFMRRFLPDAFIFVIILTIVVFLAAMKAAGASPLQMAMAWSSGMWGLLAFAMQMALVCVLGTALAKAPIVRGLIEWIASFAKTPAQGVMLTLVVSAVTCFINWGFGLIVGALFGRAVARRIKNVDYPMLIAAAYTGFAVWHGGLSGSIPLSLNAASNLHPEKGMANTGGAVTQLIGTGETILTSWNIIMLIVFVVLATLVFGMSHPEAKDTLVANPKRLQDAVRRYQKPVTPAEKIEDSSFFALIIGMAGFVALFVLFFLKIKVNGVTWGRGMNALDLNTVNFLFLMLGLFLYGSPVRYAHAIADAAANASGIILQFPFYAGIQAMMLFAGGDTGVSLAAVISLFFAEISTAATFPLWTFLSAGVVNFFVPSGGAQWAVQGPIMMPAGLELGVKPSVTAMAIAWGDQWTNMVQPFWALPALGIAGLGARDIMGYCVLGLLVMAVVGCVGFWMVGALGLAAV